MTMGFAVAAAGGLPTGSMTMYGGTAAPSGYLICDGTSYLRSAFPALFAVIGTTYGSVDGTHFNVPDLRQRFPLGKAASGTGSTLGGTGGVIDHTHSFSGAGHNHSVTGTHAHAISATHIHGHSGTHQHDVPYTHGSGSAGLFLSNSPFGTGQSISVSGSIAVTATSSSASAQRVSATAPGNTDAAAPGTTDAVSSGITDINGGFAGTTGTNNPPFQTVNFIIKT